MTGSGHIFGNWDAEGKGIKLKWHEGHYWAVTISRDELTNEVEYKYVILEGEKVKRWASGDNKRYNFETILDKVKNTQICKETGNYEVEVSLTTKIEYDPRTKSLTIIDSFD